jgi:sensor histidine kinase regulating citrate/malate metabolism
MIPDGGFITSSPLLRPALSLHIKKQMLDMEPHNFHIAYPAKRPV